MIEAMLKVLIEDRAYDSDDLNNDLRAKGIKLVSLHKNNRKKPTTQRDYEIRCCKMRVAA